MSVSIPDKYRRMLTRTNAFMDMHTRARLQGGAESSFYGAQQRYSLQTELSNSDYCPLVVDVNVNNAGKLMSATASW